MRLRAVTTISLLLTWVVACEPKKRSHGDVCKIEEEGTWVCADAKTGLYCKASRLVAVACRGALGCSGKPNAASCDTSTARVADRCVDAKSESMTCSEDRKTRLACINGTQAVFAECRGPLGCEPAGALAPLYKSCDRSIMNVGDECNMHGYRTESPWGACTADHSKRLACDKDEKGRFIVSMICHGPKACEASYADVSCDRSVASIGAPCARDDSNHDACTPDSTAIATCRGDKYEQKEACAPKKKCSPGRPGRPDPRCE